MKNRMTIGSFFVQPGIEVMDAEADAEHVAIHLLEPDVREVDEAIERAYVDGFQLIICHTPKTWPRGEK